MFQRRLASILYSQKIRGILNIGIPIQIGGQYFFTKNIGVNLTLADVLALGMGIGSSFHRGFENVFTLKVGPMFKF